MKKTVIWLFIIILFFLSPELSALVRLPALISNGMILQRNTEIKIWGWADIAENVTVKFLDSVYHVVANEKGEWHIILPGLKAGGPYTMQINAGNSITIDDILVGDVWVCSGQSNMEIPMRRVSWIYEKEVAEADYDKIRQFYVPRTCNFSGPQDEISSGSWKPANAENIYDFSAVAYFFAKNLYDKYKVPVGLINSALGGSPAEAWISEESLKQFPHHYNELQRFKDNSLIEEIEKNDRTRVQKWYTTLGNNDEGYKNTHEPWYDPATDVTDWKTMKIPGYWADEEPGKINGVIWFRKKALIPSSMAGKEALLILGRIIDSDSVFMNGVFVGTTGYQYPPRRYIVPAGLLKEGENTIVVRVISNSGRGGFVPDKSYELVCGTDKIDLQGDWHYQVGAFAEPMLPQTFIRGQPAGLFNAMIAPLLNYSIKGVIWYQGESNAERPGEYFKLFSTVISDWRKAWEQGDFPFLYVQLPNFMEPWDHPSESNWALLREAQLKALSLPNTAMAVAIDVGEWNDIHPLWKKEVGDRLALAAMKKAYGEAIVFSGPLYNSMQIRGSRILLSFDNLGGGLISKDGGELRQFAIAGPDKKFVWAKAIIKNNKVEVWNSNIKNPVAVRYAWADNPKGANLFNKEGLPASPFRTDNNVLPDD